MANLTIMNQTQTMSSREIAELTGKEHKNVLRDIREMLEGLEINLAQFSAQYKDSSGKQNLLFNLPKRECLILVSGYNIQLRAKIIDRWQELEQVTQTLADNAGVPKEVLIKDAKDDALLAKLQASTEASKAKIELSRLKVQTAKERDALKLKAAKEKYAEQSKVLHARTTKLLSQGALVKGDMIASKLDLPTDTITNLLKEHGSTIEPKLANWALRQLGYLTKTHEVTDTGHYYGRNIKSSPRSKTTLARWFPSEFPNLLKQIESTIEDLVNN